MKQLTANGAFGLGGPVVVPHVVEVKLPEPEPVLNPNLNTGDKIAPVKMSNTDIASWAPAINKMTKMTVQSYPALKNDLLTSILDLSWIDFSQLETGTRSTH